MNLTVRTIYGANLQTCRQLNMPVVIPQYSTINEMLTISTKVPNQPTVSPNQGMYTAAGYNYASDSDALVVQYLTIGNGGHQWVAGTTGSIPYTLPVAHLSTDSGLYSPIPFAVVLASADFNAVQAAKYRLRRTVVIGGVLYAAYYGLVLDVSTATVTPVVTTVTDGVPSPAVFTATINNLTPTPPVISTATAGSYVSVSATVNIPFTAQDFSNLQNACQLMFGNQNIAIISEIAFCSGVDKPVTAAYDPVTGAASGTIPSGRFEAVGVQANAFISLKDPISSSNAGGTITVDLGASEPLYGVTQS